MGCKVNQYDSQVLRQRLSYAGLSELQEENPVDVCIINTCTVTSRADAKSRELIRRAIRNNPQAKIIVTGCYAKDNPQALRKIGGSPLPIGERGKGEGDNRNISYTNSNNFIVDKEGVDKYLLLNRFAPVENISVTGFNGHTRAFVKIQDGCNNFCSYCKVPYVRGTSRSRETGQIKDEVRNLAENGFKEIVLCGICLGEFGKPPHQNLWSGGKDLSSKTNLVSLIEELEGIPQLKRIRLSSIEAKDVTDELIMKMASSDKLCRHLHIPFQSGDDKILTLMNRNYTQVYYIDLVDKIKSSVKDIAITTDIIAGFPGETDENFKNTIELLEKIVPLRTHIFPFSARVGTEAYYLKDRLSDNIIKERVSILKDITIHLSLLYRQHFLNKELDILIEESLDKEYNAFKGYSSNYIKVLVKKNGFNEILQPFGLQDDQSGKTAKNSLTGQLIKVRIVKIDNETTLAERID